MNNDIEIVFIVYIKYCDSFYEGRNVFLDSEYLRV